MAEPRLSTSLLQPAFRGPLEAGSRIMDGDAEPPIAADRTMIGVTEPPPGTLRKDATGTVGFLLAP